ncbi:MAG: hypothetical protein IT242_05795 [Bacteroidia bacterium]|nr:hypothetical protein [Bacteroidia bacterium]
MKVFKHLFVSVLLISGFRVHSQDLLSMVEDSASHPKDYTVATFKSTRLINMHTLATLGRRTLDFRISHRFGAINTGSYNAWGVDGPANIRLGLAYSPDGRIMVGIGRSSYEKILDGFVKYRLFRQTTDDKMPAGITLLAGMYYTAQKDPNETSTGYNKYDYLSNRLSYHFEVIAGRKFTRSFSMQFAPWLTHYNLVEQASDKNDAYGIATCIRLKFTRRSAITFEYGYRINNPSATKYYDTMGIGYELETGGHVFQVHLTNSFGITENQFFDRTETKWDDAGIRLGFNISRVFTL